MNTSSTCHVSPIEAGAGAGCWRRSAELGAPLPDRLVAEDDPASQHHLLDLTEAEREAVVEPDTVADDLRREAKPLVGRHTDGHQTSSQQQPIDHSNPQITKLTVPHAGLRLAGVAATMRRP